jgi:hypothetical protein
MPDGTRRMYKKKERKSERKNTRQIFDDADG